ncbi:IMPACT family protein [Gynurincola endophyticus]|uniref:IMPACT family protein n=1 Tax=Gynurincola endophyticus TaxID=2479004 RepID=UPI000F8E3547|nr:YigZ family protein [Gynurincola endophyticus]
MLDQEFYYTIEQNAYTEFKDRGSKFLSYAFPVTRVEDFKKCLEQVKKEHPKATHHCFAYRLGLDMNNYRVSDDGEPSGTAGKPILGQIDSKQLTNVLIVVVRYFGGTLLGVPGLINAYKNGAALVLQVTPIIQKPIEITYDIQFDYTQMNEIMMVVKQTNCTVISQEMMLFCNLRVGVPKGRVEEVLYRLGDIRNIEVKKVG